MARLGPLSSPGQRPMPATFSAGPVQDPLDPLAEALGEALVHRVVDTPAEGAQRLVMDVGSRDAVQEVEARVPPRLRARLKELVAQALQESLGAPTAEGKRLRMALVGRLAHLEMDAQAATGEGVTAAEQPAQPPADELLTTAQVAARLAMSRPYVVMLCDAGKLGEIVLTEGGHRRIRQSALEAYVAAQAGGAAAAESPRQAGLEGGLYERDDVDYVEAGHRTAAAAGGKQPGRLRGSSGR